MHAIAAALLLAASGHGPCGGASPRLASPFDPATSEGAAIAESGHAEEVRRMCGFVAGTPRLFPLRGLALPVRLAFADPFGLPEIARWATDPAAEVGDRPFRAVARSAARAFGVDDPMPAERSTYTVTRPDQAVFALDFLLNEPSMLVRKALEAAVPADADRAKVARDARAVAPESTGRRGQVMDTVGIAMRASATLDRAALVRAAAHFDEAIKVVADWSTFGPEPVPPELAGAVDGPILAAEQVPELGWLVVGGTGSNRYDMTRVAAVLDAGGDDRYDWGAGVVGNRLVIDLAGNDAHVGARAADGTLPVSGPAGAAFGVGILVDRAGDDTYAGGTWTIGAAFAGIAAVCDLGGNDLYRSETYSQACGGPGGIALLLDAAGNDRYRADGTVPSAYGTPTVHVSFSQGVGFGYRIGASGGVGALVDLAGNDRYESGEFGQGCGYYLSMGILRDGAGSDLYYGNRYAQGTAAHQSFGALLDDAGDDLYWSMTAAGQGAAWDMSSAALVDRAGDDEYRADGGLSQGAAAQQAVGMLLDLGGSDRYRAGGASQGEAGGNEYHWDASRCTSVGLLRDLAGPDRFDRGKHGGERRASGDPTAAQGNGCFGFFVTR